MTATAKPQPETVSWYERAEAGHALGLWIVELVARVFGRRVVHAFVAPIAAYFLLVRHAERRASLEFLSRVLGRRAGLRECLRHFYAFACVAADRVFLLSPRGHRIPLDVSGRHLVESNLSEGRGCILLSAHFGSFEAARQSGLAHPKLRLRLLLDRAVNRRLVERLEAMAPDLAASTIDAAGDPITLTLRIGECLNQGEWVGWLGDRYRGGERTLNADFFGEPAPFPASPFIIAGLFRVPVFLVLAPCEGRSYKVVVERLAEAKPAAQDLDAYVERSVAQFAVRLAHHVQRSPYNWFNFFDFWRAPRGDTKTVRRP